MSRFAAILPALVIALVAPSIAGAAEGELTPLARMPKNQNYRTSYGEKKLEAGVDLGFNLLRGTSTQAFNPAPSLTPYFDVSFGDGNSVMFQVTMGRHSMDPENAEYYFWRSPVLDGSSAEGELRFAIPTVAFRYENDLTRKMSGRGRAFFWASMGLGAGIVTSAAQLEGAGTLPEVQTSFDETLETFLAIVPAAGFRFRVTEFLFVNLSLRYNVLVQFGSPNYAEEGDMGGMRTFDSSFGLSYEFGPS